MGSRHKTHVNNALCVFGQTLVREIEAGIIMDIETAKIFKEWLETKICEYDQLVNNKKGGK